MMGCAPSQKTKLRASSELQTPPTPPKHTHSLNPHKKVTDERMLMGHLSPHPSHRLEN